MSPRVTRHMAAKAVRNVLGHAGRVWKTAEGWEIGFDLLPGRHVVGSGPTLIEAFSDAFLDQDAIKAEAKRIEALRASRAEALPTPSEAEIVAHTPNGEASGLLAKDSVTP